MKNHRLEGGLLLLATVCCTTGDGMCAARQREPAAITLQSSVRIPVRFSSSRGQENLAEPAYRVDVREEIHARVRCQTANGGARWNGSDSSSISTENVSPCGLFTMRDETDRSAFAACFSIMAWQASRNVDVDLIEGDPGGASWIGYVIVDYIAETGKV
uniref:Uncharacterized protein n=1 Tax=Oryza nivara TaxID=4536 RepID=A0A0E0FLK5_ORYNI